MQAAGQNVSRDGGAVGGEEPGRLPVADPNRRRDLLGTEARIGQVLLYRGARGSPVRCPWPCDASTDQHSNQVEDSVLVGRRGLFGPRPVIFASAWAYRSSVGTAHALSCS